MQGRPGDEVQSYDPARPNSVFGEFLKSSLVLVGIGRQISYEILIQFFSSSYSGSKAAQNEYWKIVRRDRNNFALFCQHIYEEWLTEEVLQVVQVMYENVKSNQHRLDTTEPMLRTMSKQVNRLNTLLVENGYAKAVEDSAQEIK